MTFLYPKGMTIDGANSVYVRLHVYAVQIVAERIPVTISNIVGTAGFAIGKNLTDIDVLFDKAYFCPNGNPVNYLVPPYSAGPTLKLVDSPPRGLDLHLTKFYVASDVVICWLSPGDYSSSLDMHFGIRGHQNQSYSENSIHVESAFVSEELKSSHMLQTIEVTALVWGSAVGVFEAFNYTEQRKSKRKSKVGRDKDATSKDTSEEKKETPKPIHKRRSPNEKNQNDRRLKP
jgi:hypothetical protein